MSVSAIILCAGRGTRMKDDSKNKVSFDCAGIPVIKRIINNMRKAGVDKFVVVVGYLAETVMEVLHDEPGVVFAYQKDQLGTGHAAGIGLKALKDMGISGSVIVTMGDKIIKKEIISDLVVKAKQSKVVWGVQPLENNKNGGRIVMRNGKPYGIVEFADAAYYSLYGLDPSEYRLKLNNIGLNPSKAEKVISLANKTSIPSYISLCDELFTAEEVLNSTYANAGLYCFDISELSESLNNLDRNNAQGEIYLTDTMEYFARKIDIELTVVNNKDDMLTYSTKPELKSMSRKFLRYVSEYIEDFQNGIIDSTLFDIYDDDFTNKKEKYLNLLKSFKDKFDDKKIIITRAPGRVNLMGRHIDHRGGSVNMMTVSKDTIMVVSPREDDLIRISSVEDKYQDREFSIGELLSLSDKKDWIEFIESDEVISYVNNNKGDWSNYIKSVIARFTLTGEDLCGMDLMIYGDLPTASGLSSSSSVVVACAEAIVSLNSLNITDKEFVELCGEGEWFVGSRGGAGDHAAMKCSKKGKIAHISFKPFEIGKLYDFPSDYTVLIANSGIKAEKSFGSKDKFNEKVAAYEIAFMLIKKSFPDLGLNKFADLSNLDDNLIYDILLDLPEVITRDSILKKLPEYSHTIKRIFSSHNDPGEYNIRGVALFGIAECRRAVLCTDYLLSSDCIKLGEMMNTSHDGDRLPDRIISYDYLKKAKDNNISVENLPGSYGCSTPLIDEICDLLKSQKNVSGCSLIGAGLGGCVVALIKKSDSDELLSLLKEKYYKKHNIDFYAFCSSPSKGSSVLY